MSILAVTLPCAGTVPMDLPPLNLTPGVADPLPSAPGVNPQPIGAQFYTDRSGVALHTVVQQPDGVLPAKDAAGVALTPTTPTADPNTTTWLTDLQAQTVIAEPFAP
jgi:hypothetical protein